MSTLTLTLDDNVVKTLHDRAAKLGVSVEHYAAALVRDQLQPLAITPKEFRELLNESIQEDDEVYRRLAN
jgi:hypothetical protein